MSEINFELSPNDFNAKVTFSPNRQYLRWVECLGEKLRIDTKSFIRCPSLVLFTFPNACEISIDPNAFVLEKNVQ